MLRVSTPPARAAGTNPLVPYVPRLVIEWLESVPEQTHQTIRGTGVFADISGFTNLTERLAKQGRVGAEEMGDTLNLIFDQLLGAAYQYGAGLVKWGGDAVLLLFEGDDHPARGARAAQEMQRVIERIGRVRTSVGSVRLRMSIGIHSGDLDFMLVGKDFRELIVTGPGASLVALMESSAEAGQIVVSRDTAELLEACGAQVGGERGPGLLLIGAPSIAAAPAEPLGSTRLDLRTALPASLAEHVLADEVAYEHRNIAVCFIEFSGVAALRTTSGVEAVASAVAQVVDACQAAATANRVTFLSSDICADGGKIILVSGAPVSAGDDSARVLTAARQVLDSPQELRLRAGVNVGRVFAGNYGPWFRRVYSVTGDCVNLAARLMAKAGPGEVIASALALQRSRTQFEASPLPPFAVKGKSELVEASVVGRARQAEPSEGATELPLIGREHEIEELLTAMASASAGNGRVVELVGEPGIGKSRLLNELVSQTDVPVLWMDGDIYATGTPYQPFHQLFAQRLGLRPGDTRGAERRVRAVVARLTPHLEPLLPLVCVVAGLDVPTTPEVEAMEPEVRKQALEATTSEVLGALFDGATLLVANDVHFMDEATTDLLDRLIADAPARTWMIVAARLPTADWQLSPATHTTTLELPPLAREAADDLLTLAIGDRHIPAHRIAALVERADGNPLFLTEMAAGIDSLLEGEAIPDSIEAIIATRIDRLTPGHRYLLRAASVLGMNLDAGMLDSVMARLNGVPPGNAHIAELGEFIERKEDGTYGFFHHLVRETAYEGLPFRLRVHVHATTAHMLARTHDGKPGPAGLLSLHCFKGQLYAEAYEHSTRAGAAARELYANTEAAECYQRALASARHLPLRDERDIAAVCEALGEIYESLGDLDAMEDSLRRARLRLRSDPQAQGRLALKTAVHRRLSGHYSDSLRWVTRGRKALAGLDDPESRRLRAQLAERYSQNLLVQGRFRAASRWADTAIEEAQIGDDPQTQARALETRSLADSFSGRRVDLELAARSLPLYASINDQKGLARGHNVMGLLSFSSNRWIVALEHYTESAEAYRQVGRQLDIALMQANAAEILIFQGELDRAESMLVDSMRVWRGTQALGERAFGFSQQGRIAMARADYVEAARLLADARSLHEEVGESYEALAVEALQAECSYLSGAAQEALDHVEEVLGRDAEVGGHLKQFKRTEGLALLTLGQRAAGERSLRESLAAARASAATYEEALALVALAHWGCASPRELATLDQLRIRVRQELGVVLAPL